MLRHVEAPAPCSILDLGCGPGRDLIAFRDLGHRPVGLDGAEAFCAMARAHSGCEVLHQDLLALDLPAAAFDGVFANATLFHVPTQELPAVLRALWAALAPRGVLFASNPRGQNDEGWHGERYGAYHDHGRWSAIVNRLRVRGAGALLPPRRSTPARAAVARDGLPQAGTLALLEASAEQEDGEKGRADQQGDAQEGTVGDPAQRDRAETQDGGEEEARHRAAEADDRAHEGDEIRHD